MSHSHRRDNRDQEKHETDHVDVENATIGTDPAMPDTGVASRVETHMNTPVTTGYSNGCRREVSAGRG